MQSNEYLLLSNAITRAVEATRHMIAKQVIIQSNIADVSKEDPGGAVDFLLDDALKNIAELQMLQKFLLHAQRKAEKIYTSKESAP